MYKVEVVMDIVTFYLIFFVAVSTTLFYARLSVIIKLCKFEYLESVYNESVIPDVRKNQLRT